MNIRNAPIKHIHAVAVRMKRRSSTGGTRFQYGWNSVPVRVELGSSRDGTRTDLSIGALRIFIFPY